MTKYRVGRLTALAVVMAAGLLYAQTGPQWQNLAPAYTGLAFGEGVFVAVSGDGVIKASEDGQRWSQRFGLAGVSRRLLSVGHSEGAGFLVTQNSTGLLRSQDGVNWRTEVSSVAAQCRYLTGGAGTFVGVSGDNTIFRYGADEWSSFPGPGTSSGLTRAAFGANRYVAVGSAIVLSSSAGIGWESAAVSSSVSLGAVAFGDAGFLALGTGGTSAHTSADGLSWIAGSADAPAGMADMTFGAGKYVAVGANGRGAWSADGASWTQFTLNEGENFLAVRFGNDVFVALGARGALYTSADGENWTGQAGGRSMTYRQIVRGGAVFVAVGDSGVMVSSDGRNWSARAAGKGLRAVAYGEEAGRFVAVGDSGARFSSADGNTWDDHSLTGANRSVMLTSVAYGGNTFIAGGSEPTLTGVLNSIVFTSSDGQSWQDQTTDDWPLSHPVAMVFGNGRFVAAGNRPGVIRLSDAAGTFPGRYWTAASLTGASSHNIVQITFSAGRFVALGLLGGVSPIVLTSTDGQTWTPTSGAPVSARSVTYAKGHYVVVADSGGIYASADGSQWHAHQRGTNRNLNTIYFDGENTLYAAGADGAMLLSTQDPVSVRYPAAAHRKSTRPKLGMTMDKTKRAPTITLSFTPEKPGTFSAYSLTGKQLFKQTVRAGERTVQLPDRLSANGTVIVKYTGGDGRTVTQRFQMTR